jgi:hypothetical protein
MQLAEYAQQLGKEANGIEGRHEKAWNAITTMPGMQHLVNDAMQLQKLLHAVDTFPRGDAATPGCLDLLCRKSVADIVLEECLQPQTVYQPSTALSCTHE